MIAELGLAALWLAAALGVLQLIGGILGLRENGGEVAKLVRPAAIMQGVLASVAFLMLLWLFAVTDLSVKLVATNSHSAKPIIFKLAGAWGNHEGSMLLWVTVMALAGGLIALAERRLPEKTMLATLAAQAFVGIGFYAFLLMSSNPFERLGQPANEGAGLNPLLQDIGLAFHPPTLYFGYVGLSVAFSFAVGALVTRQVGPAFARAMRPWVLGAWVFLTLGIVAGSYWAYYELGWGGWWFWDPVENASLMPWLAATALLHSVSVLAARDALRAWTIMLGVVAFSMSMLGTFLVRSGILTSVHAFAVDPERGTFILFLLAIYIGGALLLFALRAGTVSEGKQFAIASREGALVFNNVMLSAILGIVLLGTLYPLVTEIFDVRVSVGPPYFNPVGAIFTIPMLMVMAVGPLLRWRHDSITRIKWPSGGDLCDHGGNAYGHCRAGVLRDARQSGSGDCRRIGSGCASAAAGAQYPARSHRDMGHGGGAFRNRRGPVRHGQRIRLFRGTACRSRAWRQHVGRPVDCHFARCASGRGAELDCAAGQSASAIWRRGGH